MNKVILSGNLGADPELRFTPTGTPVANARLATNESWTGKDGKRQERTEWHTIVAWGKAGENLAKYMKKGGQLTVEGQLRTRSWVGEDGVKRYKTEVVAQPNGLTYGPRAKSGGGAPSDGVPEEMDEADFSDVDDNIPV